MATTHRVSRVRELLLREFSDIVRRLKDPRVRFVTVVDTEVSKDLRYAKMFISVIGSQEDREDATDALNHARGYIRREVAKRLPMRHAPEIAVAYDDTAERASQLTSLIDRANIASGVDVAAGDREE